MLPGMIPDSEDQAFTSLLMLARAPCEAIPGVSVLPSSVMSGPPLPLVRALVQSVTRFPQGIHSPTTLVLAYCGNFWWNWLTTPFIQVTWDGTDEPIRQTTSLAGADEPAAELPLEPHPAMPAAAPVSMTAAPTAAADLVRFTPLRVIARSPFPALPVAESRPPGGRLRPGRAAGG